MITIYYDKPHKPDFNAPEDVWLIGWSKGSFDKVKVKIFHRGNYKSAVDKLATIPARKYKKRPIREITNGQ